TTSKILDRNGRAALRIRRARFAYRREGRPLMTGNDGSRTFAGGSRRALAPWVATLCCLARLARADSDPSGAWTVALDVPDPTFGQVAVTVNLQRSGSELSAYVTNYSQLPFQSFPYHLTGSIDSASGAFSVSGDSPCRFFGLGGTDSIA